MDRAALTAAIAAGRIPQTEHPVVPLLTPERLLAMPVEQAFQLWQKREEVIAAETRDPLRYGHRPKMWRRADAVIEEMRQRHPRLVLEMLALGGNRAGKTEWAARKTCEILTNQPKSVVWCLHAKEDSSRAIQQARIFKYLPAEWRPASGKLKKSRTVKLNYSEAGGFTENMFALPNGSKCYFKFYSQDVRTVEGDELDAVWSDELVPLDWVEAMKRRLASRAGLHVITFTPIEGYSPTVSYFLNGAVATEETPAELLPIAGPGGVVAGHEMVPLVQRCREATKSVVYFHTKDNPYGQAYETLAAMAQTAGRNEIKAKLYGIPTKVRGAKFPTFRPTLGVHLCRREDLRHLCPKGSDYHVVDPCSGRNFYMLWARARGNRIYILSEWPMPSEYIQGIGQPGQWAELSQDGKKLDGQRGEAQQPFGFGIRRYIEEFERKERWLACSVLGMPEGSTLEPERIMDSRFGASPTQTKEGRTTLIDEFADEGIDFDPASGEHQDEGWQLIHDALAYNEAEPVSSLNAPSLVICDDCENLIFALTHFTGADGAHGACKDPIDVLRYLLLAKPVDFASSDYRQPARPKGRLY